MTLFEMKKKVLALIEELNPDSEYLTDDPDIATKINEVINQIMYELVRYKKLPKFVEMEVTEGDLIAFEDIEDEVEREIFQLGTIGGVRYSPKANGTVLKILESGVAEIECYVYPKRITERTVDQKYVFEIGSDLLEVMPYGVAGDLLKSDVSAEYGNVYSSRYESMKQMIDPRYQMAAVMIEGGIDV